MNIWDWVITIIILIAVYFALRTLRKGKAGGCSGACAACPHYCAVRKDRE